METQDGYKICIEKVTPDDPVLQDRYEDMQTLMQNYAHQSKANAWVKEYLKDVKTVYWVQFDGYNNADFIKVVEKSLDFICKATGAGLISNLIGLMNEKGAYIMTSAIE